jgi:uncharacterized protein with GYD domain
MHILNNKKSYDANGQVKGTRFGENYREEEGIMPIYVMMTNLTDEGRRTVKTNPQRIKEVNKEVEGMGVKILAQYVVLGQYDFINILEAPNNETIARVATELGSRGTLQTNTMAAIKLDDYIKSLSK